MRKVYSKIYFLALLLSGTFLAKAQNFTSNMPIIIVETEDEIVDEPDVLATIKVIDNGDGNPHTINDVPAYEGHITIEIRGNSSQGFPKRPYGLETSDAEGNDIDTTLLGLPAEEDWIFYSSWADKTYLRNALSMKLSREMGHYSSRTRFFELIINDEYEGVYMLMEKVKRDKNRVDIAKLTESDNAGAAVTGGYILKFDWWEEPGWEARSETVTGNPLYIQYVYPKPENLTDAQADYIQTHIDSFELALFADDYTNPFGQNYLEYIDAESFADMLIINELSKNVDGYKLSTYFHKVKDSDGGKITAGPIWDYDIAWYNSSYCAGGDYENWIYNEMYCEDLELMPLWWERFMSDPSFLAILCQRWHALRTDVLHQDSLFQWIDTQAAFLTDAQTRNEERWNSLEESTWDHPEIAGTYMGEVENLKTFIENRLAWMDENIDCSTVSLPQIETNVDFQIVPNPSADGLFVVTTKAVLEDCKMKVYSPLGELVLEKKTIGSAHTIDLQGQAKGVYFLTIENREGKEFTRKLVYLSE